MTFKHNQQLIILNRLNILNNILARQQFTNDDINNASHYKQICEYNQSIIKKLAEKDDRYLKRQMISIDINDWMYQNKPVSKCIDINDVNTSYLRNWSIPVPERLPPVQLVPDDMDIQLLKYLEDIINFQLHDQIYMADKGIIQCRLDYLSDRIDRPQYEKSISITTTKKIKYTLLISLMEKLITDLVMFYKRPLQHRYVRDFQTIRSETLNKLQDIHDNYGKTFLSYVLFCKLNM
jgi:hypothetical protein